MLSRDDLHEYQHRAINFIKDKKRAFLMLDLGLGKSVITLTAVSDLIDGFAVKRTLIIAPLRVAKSVWMQEAARWSHLTHLRVEVCTGTARERLSTLCKDADIYVINRENVSWLTTQTGKNWPFDCVIVDESSSFKNPSSIRFRALRKHLPKINYLVLLTGTPSPNGLIDLWAQAYMIDFGESLGRTLSSYRDRFFDSDYSGFGYVQKAGADKKVQDLMRQYCLSMSNKDYLDLPDRINVTHNVFLPEKVIAQYKDFEKTLFLEVGGVEITATNAAVLAGKLLQYAAGAVYIDDQQTYKVIHDEKVKALQDLIEENAGENILLAYNFKSDLERLQKAFPTARVLDKNQSTIDEWNAGKIPLLLAHPASAGHGLNLQQGGNLIVWFGPTWSLELHLQFNARLHRQGQSKPVRIITLSCSGTLDERVSRVLSDKNAMQNNLLKALKN